MIDLRALAVGPEYFVYLSCVHISQADSEDDYGTEPWLRHLDAFPLQSRSQIENLWGFSGWTLAM